MGKQWSSEQILEIGRSFQPMCILAAGAELDLFKLLTDGPLTAQAVTDRLEADLRATTTLLDALTALALLEKNEGQYRLAAGVEETLTADGQQSVLAMVLHQTNCMRRWSQLAWVVKNGAPAERVPSIRGAAADQAAFVEAMNDINRQSAAELIDDIEPKKYKHLLDIGGATGTFTIAFLKANPAARATLFDLPEVIPQAHQRLTDMGLIDRVDLVGGDFYTDPLPEGSDVALLSAIVHQNSREQNRDLLSKIKKVLPPGGEVIIRDIVMEESRVEPPGGALFAVNMLVATEGGGTFTYNELNEDLQREGFTEVEMIRKDQWMNSLLRAKARSV
jgi:ubiquinone/menaquinone biosynthesis C-methylase UbiE